MAENSNIEWTRHTFNPWIGCQKVGPGCDHCYAETWDARGLQQRETRWGPHAARTRTSAANWRKPLAWDRAAAAAGERHRVFCASLADVFDNHDSILPEWRGDLWALIRATPNLDWMLLTKRPGNIAKMLPADWNEGWPNVWLGCTVVNQGEADRDIPKLLAVPGAVRFLSMEPLLGQVNIEPWLNPDQSCEGCDDGEGYGTRCSRSDIPRNEQCPWVRAVQAVTEHGPWAEDGCPAAVTCEVQTLDLVIVGGESGPGARPMHPDWARSLRDQCQAAGVAFHFKQWGEWQPFCETADGKDDSLYHPPQETRPDASRRLRFDCICFDADGALHDLGTAGGYHRASPGAFGGVKPMTMFRVGKKRAGRLLDGRTWDEMPGVQNIDQMGAA